MISSLRARTIFDRQLASLDLQPGAKISPQSLAIGRAALVWYDRPVPPRCFPPEPEFGDKHRAERRVWEALDATLPDDASVPLGSSHRE
jgi:hypothetical protein